MEQEHNHDFTEEVQTAVEKYAQLSDIQLCDKIAEIKDLGAFHDTIECMEALMMRLLSLSEKELDSLMKYAEIKCEEGNLGYASVLNVFAIKDLCEM